MPTAWELRTVKLSLLVIREFYCLKLLSSRFIQKLFISSESEMQCTNFKKIGLVRWKIVKHTSFLTLIESKSRLLRVVFRAPRSIFLISIFLYKSELDQHKIKPEFQERNFISRRDFFDIFRPPKTDITGKDPSLHNFHGVCYYVIFTSELEGFWDSSDWELMRENLS